MPIKITKQVLRAAGVNENAKHVSPAAVGRILAALGLGDRAPTSRNAGAMLLERGAIRPVRRLGSNRVVVEIEELEAFANGGTK